MTPMKIRTFRDLEAWKKSCELAHFVYDVTGKFPKEEKYAITAQLRRAVTAIGANIAQGFGRATTPELLNALRIARGELEESRHFLVFSSERKYLDGATLDRGLDLCDSAGKLINALGTSLKARAQSMRKPQL